jgi:hypothetical protein
MPTQFDNSFINGEPTDANHIQQIFQPIWDLETGKAHFRYATYASGAYSVDFTQASNSFGHFLSALDEGQPVVFKADVESSAGDFLSVSTEGSIESHPLFVGGEPVSAGDIQAEQIVLAVYNTASGGSRFDVIGIAREGGGGGGATSLDELSDVVVNAPQFGEVLQHNGAGNFINRSLAAAGIAASVHTHDAADIVSGIISIARGGTGAQTAAGARTALDVPSNADLTNGLAARQSLSEKGQADGYASLDSSGKVPLSQLPPIDSGATSLDELSDVAVSSPQSGEVLQHNGIGNFVNRSLAAAGIAASAHTHPISDVVNLQSSLDGKQATLTGTTDVPGLDSALAGKANAAHTHDAAEIVSGIIPIVRGGTGAATASGARDSLGAQAQSPVLDQMAALPYSKGDLIVYNGSAIVTLEPGSDGQLLRADSAQSSGLSWVTPGAGGGSSTLAESQVGFGSALNEVTGSSSFTYDDASSTLDVENIRCGSMGEGSITCPGAGSGTEQFGANTDVGNYLKGSAFGKSAKLTGDDATAVGSLAKANLRSTAVGAEALSTGEKSVAVGRKSKTSADEAVALGSRAEATQPGAIAMGFDALADELNAAVMGSMSQPICNLYLGSGRKGASPVASTIQATGGEGTNCDGADLKIAGGRSTGCGCGGSVVLATSPPGPNGSQVNPLQKRLEIDCEGKMAFFGVSPVARSYGWSVNQPQTRKSLDVDCATLNEVREVLGTLLRALKDLGLLG